MALSRIRWVLGFAVASVGGVGCEGDDRCQLTATCPLDEADAGERSDEGPAPTGPSKPGTPNPETDEEDAGAVPVDLSLPLVPLPPAESDPLADASDGEPGGSMDAAPSSTDDAATGGPANDAGSDGGASGEQACSSNNGDCDPLTTCTDTPSGAECGACPDGFAGDGTTGCTPTLLGVSLSHGALSPELDPGLDVYDVVVPVYIETVTLGFEVPMGATATIRGAAVPPNSGWTSPRLDLGLNTFTVAVEMPGQSSAAYTLRVTRGAAATAYIKASNTDAGDYFGGDIALSADGMTLAVAASGESSSATGVGGDESSNTSSSTGAVYVFTRLGEIWSQQAYIKASNAAANDRFGSALALSWDGTVLAVGARGEDSGVAGTSGSGQDDNSASAAGAVYVFSRSGSGWTQQAYLKASNPGEGDNFGETLALSSDGTTLAVGAASESSNATGTSGSGQENDDAANAGAIYVFDRSGNTWAQQAYLKASNSEADDYFGYSVALSGDGTTLAVGAWGEDSSATGINDNQSSNDVNSAGAAYVLVRSGNGWSQQAYIKASNPGVRDQFGCSVALSADGNILTVGALGEASAATGINGDQDNEDASFAGAAYVFARAGGIWSQQAYLKAGDAAGDTYLGTSLALSADGATLVVGAVEANAESSAITGNGSTPAGVVNAGLAYVFVLTTNGWAQHAAVRAPSGGALDYFGWKVALSADGTTLAVGAPDEDGNATGTSGDGQSNNDAESAGAVYVHR